MYQEFEKQDPKTLDFKIICPDTTIYLHSTIISQIAHGVIETLLGSSSIEAETNEIKFREHTSDIVKIYIKYLYFSDEEFSSLLSFTDVFEEIKLIDSVLNFANFLDDTNFFNAVLEYILTLSSNRHMNTLFQYKDIQSHNEKLQRCLLKMKIQSERDYHAYSSTEIQRKYLTKLEFLGVSTLRQLNIKNGHQNMVFRTQECGVISIDSDGYLFSIVDNIKDINDNFLILNNDKRSMAKRNGVFFVHNMKKFLCTLKYSKFVPNIGSDKFDQSRCQLFRGTSEKIIERVEKAKIGENLYNFKHALVK
jgi:hypothetical protein